jgi:pimeloyl-ACP methyl ester carboxylesterase
VLAAPSSPSATATATTTTITVHGINAAPETMQPIHERARRQGHRVLTYVYDDQHRRLTQSARELGRELRALDGRGPLEIVGHSMGARVAVAALALDEGAGHFESVTLQLIAPALAGFAAADGVGLTPLPLAWIGGLRPAQDLGPSSTFQETINGYRPAPNVAVSIFVGSADKVVDPRSDRLREIAKHLHANLVIVDSEDHDSIVRFVARMSSGSVSPSAPQ